MTHNEKRVEWYREGIYNLLSGAVFGAFSILVGHPTDTIKTKMQAQKEYVSGFSMVGTMQDTWRKYGIRGFYRGALPPFFGALLTRSSQFSVFEGIFTYFDKTDSMKKEVPFTFGLQPRVILGGAAAGITRSFIESPFEYIKVRRQIGLPWNLRDSYKGFPSLVLRNIGMLGTFFCLVDIMRRRTGLYNSLPGQFFVGGACATLGWLTIWPIENLKNQIQAGTNGENLSWATRFKMMRERGGIRGLYRGILPGSICVFTRNGAAFTALTIMNKTVVKYIRGVSDK